MKIIRALLAGIVGAFALCGCGDDEIAASTGSVEPKQPEGLQRLVYHEWNKRLAGFIGARKAIDAGEQRPTAVNDATLFSFIYWYHAHHRESVPVYGQFDRSMHWIADWVSAAHNPTDYLLSYRNAFNDEEDRTVAELEGWRDFDIGPIDNADFSNADRFSQLLKDYATWSKNKAAQQGEDTDAE